MPLPSNIPRYDSVDLIDLDVFPEHIVRRPAAVALAATWGKLEETERRLIMFEWGIHVVRDPGRNRLLIRDLASAFLQSFEGTFQVLESEALKQRGETLHTWLATRPPYDLTCKALRTLRILDAHIQSVGLAVGADRAYSAFASGGDPGWAVGWRFPAISLADFQRIDRPKLDPAENAQWSSVAARRFANELMRDGTHRLSELVSAAQAVAGQRP